MAQRRSNALFIVVNVVISLAVALIVITVYSSTQPEEEPRARPTIVLVVTATLDPRLPLPAEALQGTLDAQSGTLVVLERDVVNANAALAEAQSQAQAAPDDQPSDVGTVPELALRPTTIQASDPDLPTIDPQLIPPLPTNPGAGGGGVTGAAEITATPEDGCVRYFVASGDTASTIAARFEVSLSALFVLNGINDQTILQVGDELLIPSATCQQEIPPTATPLPQPTFNLTIVAPTATLPPVAEDSQVQIVQILNPGDITTEQVEIQNLGGEISLEGWTLSDSQGNFFTFPTLRLVPGSVVRVSSRVGTNTPGFLYWNQNRSVWELGEVATLTDAEGVVQSIYTLQGQVIDFSGTPTP